MPSSFVFTATSPSTATGNGLARGLNAGAANDTAEEIFRKHFNPSSSIDTYEPGWEAWLSLSAHIPQDGLLAHRLNHL